MSVQSPFMAWLKKQNLFNYNNEASFPSPYFQALFRPTARIYPAKSKLE